MTPEEAASFLDKMSKQPGKRTGVEGTPQESWYNWAARKGEPIGAFGARAVRTATGDLIDYPEAWLSGRSVEDVRKEFRDVAERNPVANVAGDVAGNVAQAIPLFKGLKAVSAGTKLGAALASPTFGGGLVSGGALGATQQGITEGLRATGLNERGANEDNYDAASALKRLLAATAFGAGTQGGANVLLGRLTAPGRLATSGKATPADDAVLSRAATELDTIRTDPQLSTLRGQGAPSATELARKVGPEAEDIAGGFAEIQRQAGRHRPGGLSSGEATAQRARTEPYGFNDARLQADKLVGKSAEDVAATTVNTAPRGRPGQWQPILESPVPGGSVNVSPEVDTARALIANIAQKQATNAAMAANPGVTKTAAQATAPNRQAAAFFQEGAQYAKRPDDYLQALQTLARADPRADPVFARQADAVGNMLKMSDWERAFGRDVPGAASPTGQPTFIASDWLSTAARLANQGRERMTQGAAERAADVIQKDPMKALRQRGKRTPSQIRAGILAQEILPALVGGKGGWLPEF